MEKSLRKFSNRKIDFNKAIDIVAGLWENRKDIKIIRN